MEHRPEETHHEEHHHHHALHLHIFVNGTSEVWDNHKISYEEAVRLAFPNGATGGNIRYTVSWTKPEGQEGSLRAKESVNVVNEMRFDVRNTDKS